LGAAQFDLLTKKLEPGALSRQIGEVFAAEHTKFSTKIAPFGAEAKATQAAQGKPRPGEAPPWDRLAIGGALALLYLALACLFFFAVYRSVIRNGLIARYSAETVT
jgi:hypothetical protein